MANKMPHPYQPSKKMDRRDLKKQISSHYDRFESRKYTVAQALLETEETIESLKQKLWLYNSMRNDMSSHMGSGDDVFDRKRNTQWNERCSHAVMKGQKMFRPDSITAKSVGLRISGLLKIKGIPQADIAENLDPPVTVQAVSDCIYWRNTSPRIRKKISIMLGLPVSDLWPAQDQLEEKNRAVA